MDADTAPIHSCWNQIGVWGARSCHELEQHVHCRYCPVYMRAAARILDREIPADYGQLWDEAFVLKEHRREEDTVSLIIFRLGDEWLALSTIACAEVSEPGPVHTIPHRNDQIVLGVVNIRGELLICVNLARVMGVDGLPAAQGFNRFLVYGSGAQRVVFPVSEVRGVCRISAGEIGAAPTIVAKAKNSFTVGVLTWSGYSVGVLEGDALMDAVNRRLS